MLFLPPYWINAKHSQFLKTTSLNSVIVSTLEHGHDPWSVPHMYAAALGIAALGISPKTKIHNYSSPTRSPKLTERKSFTFKFRLLTLSINISSVVEF
jgi:hypothetical protein